MITPHFMPILVLHHDYTNHFLRALYSASIFLAVLLEDKYERDRIPLAETRSIYVKLLLPDILHALKHLRSIFHLELIESCI